MLDEQDNAGGAIQRIAMALGIPVERFYHAPDGLELRPDEREALIESFVNSLGLKSAEARARLSRLIRAEIEANHERSSGVR